MAALRKQAHWQIYHYNQTNPDQDEQRQQMLNELVDCPSQDAYIEVPTRMDYGHNLHLGKHFYADYGSIFLDVAPITIGDNVLLGPAVSVYTAGHPLDVPIRNEDLEYGYPITIGNNVWIGGNAVLCPGITIGDNTVIGAGSIVTKDIPANVVAAGNPARIIRPITADDTRYWQAQKQTYLQARDEG